jgi:hypothetical protein
MSNDHPLKWYRAGVPEPRCPTCRERLRYLGGEKLAGADYGDLCHVTDEYGCPRCRRLFCFREKARLAAPPEEKRGTDREVLARSWCARERGGAWRLLDEREWPKP